MKKLFIATLLSTPLMAFAQPRNFGDLVETLLNILQLIVPVIFGLTFIVLAWGISKAWIFNSDNETEVAHGRQLVLAGIIALVVMSGIWGILAILRAGLFTGAYLS